MSGLLSWLSDLVFGVDADEEERKKLKQQLEEARRNEQHEIDDRSALWLSASVNNPKAFNVFIAIVDRERWEQSVGTYADSDNQTVRLFSTLTAAEYLKANHFTPAFMDKERSKYKERQLSTRTRAAHSETVTAETNAVLVVYVYLYNQEEEARQFDNPRWKGDVRFKKGFGTILHRAIDRHRDVHAAFKPSINVVTGKVRFPSTHGMISPAFVECARQYGMKCNPANWRFDISEIGDHELQ